MICSSFGIDDRELGDRDDELAAPSADVAHLLDDLVLEVPRQDQDVVGLERVDRVDRMDRDVHAGREPAVLVRVAIDRELEEVGADPAVVQKRVALARRAVAADRPCPRPWPRSGTTAGCAWCASPARRRTRRSRRRASRRLRSRARRSDTLPGRSAAPSRRARDRPAASRHGSDSSSTSISSQAVPGRQALDRDQREVGEVLVVDRVELVLRHQPLEMRELQRDHALRREQPGHAGDEVVEVGDLRQDVVADDQIRPPAFGDQGVRQLDAEEVDARRDAACRSRPGRRSRRARCRAPARPSGRKCCSR